MSVCGRPQKSSDRGRSGVKKTSEPIGAAEDAFFGLRSRESCSAPGVTPEPGTPSVYCEIIIRKVETRDVPAIAALAGELGYPTSNTAIAERLAAIAGRDDHEVFVAEEDGECTGWIEVCLVDSLSSDRFGEIAGLVVTQRKRGSGTGSALVHRAEGWAAQWCDRIRVRSNVVRVRTHGFYERLGYRTTKSQKVFEKTLD